MKRSTDTTASFQKTIWKHYRKHKRDFPWRRIHDAYAILVSEIMLQQTQADRVVPFFNKWMKEFPTVKALAQAPLKKVLRAWSGLGYNRRALNLKRAAEIIVREYGGAIPNHIEKIDALPGVGPYTAGALAAFAFGIAVPFIETNIRTVYLHFFFKGKTKVRDAEILELIQRTLPTDKQHSNILKNVGMSRQHGSVREWYHALMDYGAMLKKTVGNPNRRSAKYSKQSAFKGSRRELRGAILRCASEKGSVTLTDFQKYQSAFSVSEVFSELVSEGFLQKKEANFFLV